MSPSISDQLLASAQRLADAVDRLSFAEPTTHIYNPLHYARAPHERFLRLHGNSAKKVVFMGMNPGPFGMAQTGVPFGEIEHVRDWIGVEAPVEKPANEHPKRPIEGFACTRSEVSGRRLWGAFKARFGAAEA
ncbi:MAG: single-stranded DNA-binding protein, partial [Opitutales bacterium]